MSDKEKYNFYNAAEINLFVIEVMWQLDLEVVNNIILHDNELYSNNLLSDELDSRYALSDKT